MRYFVTAIVVFVLVLGSCSAQKQVKPGEHFWSNCQEVVSARSDGFQHFVCIDARGHKWEVTVRPEKRP